LLGRRDRMKVQLTNNRKRSALAFLVLVGLLLLVTPSSTFGDADEIYDKVLEVSDDDGNEATGQVAAWFLVAALSGFAILLKFKVVPTTYRKTLFKVHTNGIAFASVVYILLLGHLIVD
jgi:drug/metabolite transporter (DMT)-like permease